MNALHGNAENNTETIVEREGKPLKINNFYELIIKMIQKNYSPIVIIYRDRGLSADFLQKVKHLGVYWFSCDRRYFF